MKVAEVFMARWQSGNAADCKSVIHRFESDSSLQQYISFIKEKYGNVAQLDRATDF